MPYIKITVIVPVYNAEQYISKCIESILEQTYTNLQIILVDDGSTDGSGELCDRYAALDRRVDVCHTTNRGLVAARKEGIRKAQGDYVGFVDADDYIEPNMYELLLNELIESKADFVHTGYIEENGHAKRNIWDFENGIFELENVKDREEFLVRYVLKVEKNKFISYSIWSKLYKRELITESYFLLQDNQQYGEDLLSLCLCILHSKRVALSRHALYHYVVRKNSMSHLYNIEYFMKEIELSNNISKSIYTYDKQIYSELKGRICGFLISRFIDSFEEINRKIRIQKFWFEDISILRGKKIAIYGAGAVGRDFYVQFSRYRDIEIVAWFDSEWESRECDYTEIVGADRLNDYQYENIVIAVNEEIVAREIENMLLKYGKTKEMIIWQKPGNIWGI